MKGRQNALVTIESNDGTEPLSLRLSVAQTGGYVDADKIRRGVYTRIWAVASGGSGGYVLSITSGSLPTGMGTMSATTGESYGTPTTIGRSEFVVQVQDSSSTVASHSFAVTVIGALVVVAGTPIPSEELLPYDYQFIVRDRSGTPLTSGFSVSSGSIPTDYSLSSGGALTGTAAVFSHATWYFTVTATDGTDSVDIPCQLIVYPVLTFAADFDVEAPAAIPTSINVHKAFGGMPPYMYNVRFETSLPGSVWLVYNSKTGEVYGTPPTVAIGETYDVITTARDQLGAVATQTIEYTVTPPPNGQIQPQESSVDVGPAGPTKFNFTGSGVDSVINDGTTATVTIPGGIPDAPSDGTPYARQDGGWVNSPGRATAMNEQTGTTYTLVLTDATKAIRCTNGSTITLTVPTNATVALPLYQPIAIFQGGAGAVTIVGASGVTIETPFGAATTAVKDFRVIYQRATNIWVVG